MNKENQRRVFCLFSTLFPRPQPFSAYLRNNLFYFDYKICFSDFFDAAPVLRRHEQIRLGNFYSLLVFWGAGLIYRMLHNFQGKQGEFCILRNPFRAAVETLSNLFSFCDSIFLKIYNLRDRSLGSQFNTVQKLSSNQFCPHSITMHIKAYQSETSV